MKCSTHKLKEIVRCIPFQNTDNCQGSEPFIDHGQEIETFYFVSNSLHPRTPMSFVQLCTALELSELLGIAVLQWLWRSDKLTFLVSVRKKIYINVLIE